MSSKLRKQRAVETIRTSKPNAVLIGCAYILITALMSFFVSNIQSANVTTTSVAKFYDYLTANRLDYALEMLQQMSPPTYSYFIRIVVSMVSSIVYYGFLLFLLNTVRHQSPCLENLLDGFGFWFKIILLEVLTWTLVFLWGLLLIIPGFIASYRYAMAPYILCDDPSKSVGQCLRESSQMMKGHKKELFFLELSFIGWILLTCLPVVSYAASMWFVPYFGIVRVQFYEDLLPKVVTPDPVLLS